MATATVGALKVVLGLDSASFTDGLSGAQKHLKQVGSQMQKTGATIATAGAAMTATISTGFVALGFHLLQGSQDAAAAAAQVNAALASMGNASGKTFDELSKTAESLRNLTGVDDDEILSKVTANLLTFGNVAGNTFDRAQVAVLDLSARMGGDLQSATMMVGKALNDPVKGLTALRRTGIQFTEEQENQIKAMAAVGDMAGAQSIMLGELERQFGGAAKAAGDADIWKPLKTGLMDLEGAFEPIVRDVVAPLVQGLAGLMRAFTNLSPGVQMFVAIGAAIAAALGPVLVAVGAVVGAIGTLTTALAAGGIAAGFVAALPVIAAVAAAVGVAVAAFMLFKDDVGPVLNAFGAQIAQTMGPPLKSMLAAAKSAFDALMPAFIALGDRVGPILKALAEGFVSAMGPTILQILRVLAAGVTNAFNVIAKTLNLVTALLKGDWSAAWNAAGSLVMEVLRSIGRIVEALFPGMTEHIRKMVQGVSAWLTGKLFDVLDGVIRKVKGVSDAFFRMYDAVVGHSYVPDMVEGVAEWMAKLDAGMVQPAVSATDATKAAFEKLRDDVAAIMEGLLTDSERAARELANKTKTIRDGVAAGLLTANQGAQAEAGIAGQNLTMPDTIGTISPIDTSSVEDAMASINAGIEASREKFADAFEYGIDAALRGDWQGLLSSIVGDSFRDGMKNLGRMLFDAIGKGNPGGGGFSLSGIGSAISSFFSKGIPGFSTGVSNFGGGLAYVHGGEVLANLAPGTDVIPKREVGKLGRGGGGAVTHVVVSTNDDRFNAYVDDRAARPAAAAFSTARKAVPADMARTDRYTLGRRR